MEIGEEWDVEEADDAGSEDDGACIHPRPFPSLYPTRVQPFLTRCPQNPDSPLTQPRHGPSTVSVLFIVLVVLACLILIALIVLIVVCVRRRRRQRAATAAAATSGNGPRDGATASEVAHGKQPERADLQIDFAETGERPGDVPMASGGVGLAGAGAGASGEGRATTLMPIEFFAPGPGDDRGGR